MELNRAVSPESIACVNGEKGCDSKSKGQVEISVCVSMTEDGR